MSELSSGDVNITLHMTPEFRDRINKFCEKRRYVRARYLRLVIKEALDAAEKEQQDV